MTLVVIVDKKYKRAKAKSFISQGPLLYLANNTRSIIIYHDFKDLQIDDLAKQIRTAVRKISKGVDIDTSVSNPIAAQYFLLIAIYVMEPINKKMLNDMIQVVGEKSSSKITTIVTSSLNILLQRKEVTLQDGQYQLTKDGFIRFRNAIKIESKWRDIEDSLDKLRVDYLNHTLRRRN